jgi:glycosyltransferase 2 family protein
MIVSAPWFLNRFGFALQGWLPSFVAAALLLGIAALAQLDRLPAAWQRFLPLRLLGSLGAATRELFLRPSAALPAIGAAVAGQIALAVATYAMALSLNINIGLMDCIVIMQVVALIVAIPISVGGWGMRELSVVALLGLIGVPSGSALLLSIQLGLVALAVNLPGAAFWLTLRPRGQTAPFEVSAQP